MLRSNREAVLNELWFVLHNFGSVLCIKCENNVIVNKKRLMVRHHKPFLFVYFQLFSIRRMLGWKGGQRLFINSIFNKKRSMSS